MRWAERAASKCTFAPGSLCGQPVFGPNAFDRTTSIFGMGGGTLKDLYTTYVIKRLWDVAKSWFTVSPPARML